MMSLHSATHSSQMKTRGPEINFRTSRRLFPQKEQWKSSITHHYYTGAPSWPIGDRRTRLLNGNRAAWAGGIPVELHDGLVAAGMSLEGEAPAIDVSIAPIPEGHH